MKKNGRDKFWQGYKAIIRAYPGGLTDGMIFTAENQKRAVEAAIEETKALPDGEFRLKLIDLVFWKKSHTLSGAAPKCGASESTARRWHTSFIRAVASNLRRSGR